MHGALRGVQLLIGASLLTVTFASVGASPASAGHGGCWGYGRYNYSNPEYAWTYACDDMDTAYAKMVNQTAQDSSYSLCGGGACNDIVSYNAVWFGSGDVGVTAHCAVAGAHVLNDILPDNVCASVMGLYARGTQFWY